MSRRYSRDSIDSNHNDIVKTFRSLGCIVRSTTCVKGFCDMVVVHDNNVILVEVKDGEKPPSQRKLTPMELEFHNQVETKGCKVYIIESNSQAIELIKTINNK